MKKFLFAFMALTAAFFALAACIPPPSFARETDRPRVVSEAAVVIDADTGQVLYNKDMDKRMNPASITKVLTGLIAVENCRLSETFSVSHRAVFSIDRSSSNIALQEGETITVEQALYAMSIESANDAAAALAEYMQNRLGKDISRLMNERAAKAGAKNSNFVNPHGLYDENHYTTAHDMALITARRGKSEVFNKIFSAGTYTMPPTNKQSESRVFHSQNWFFNGAFDYPGVVMGKIGWTEESGHTMTTMASVDGVNLVRVVMNSRKRKDKWDDTETLFDWAFENYKKTELAGSFVALMAPEEIPVDRDGRFYVKKEDITLPDVSVLLPKNLDRFRVKASFSPGGTSRDGSRTELAVTLYTGSGDDATVLATLTANARVTERAGYYRRTAGRGRTKARRSFGADMAITLIFSLMTFVCAMVLDITFGKRD